MSWLLGIFALAALAFAAIGIGVMAYVVGRRTREIGIRVALGAARPRLLFDVLREGMLHAEAGLVLGVLASLSLTRFVRSQLFGLEATDPATSSRPRWCCSSSQRWRAASRLGGRQRWTRWLP